LRFFDWNEMTFDSLGLDPTLVAAVTSAGYTTPTSVQAESIPVALSGADMMVSAATGSGKTAAFMLPALQRILATPKINSIGPRVLVLCPTRELAQQVAKSATVYGKPLKRLAVVTVVGGMPYPLQLKMLRKPVDVLVATPGRLIDYIDRGRIDFSRTEMLILDEADRMLDMGFMEDIERIVAALPAQRQTVMFSATFAGPVSRLAASMLQDPQRIELANATDRHADIEQRIHWADDTSHKNRLLEHLLKGQDVTQAIIFAATKRDADWLSESLADKGYAAAALHGDMPQAKRNRTLTGLRRGEIKILVATDVAARGIDVPNISHVINYGMPMKPEDYVHRIGRTGRAGHTGIAITLAVPSERSKIRAIERYTTQQIPASVIEGMEPHFNPQQRDRRSFDDRPRRSSSGSGERRFGDRPAYGDRSRSSAPQGAAGARPPVGDRPRSFNDRPRSNAERKMGDRPRSFSDKPVFGGERHFDGPPRAAAPAPTRDGQPRTFSREGRNRREF